MVQIDEGRANQVEYEVPGHVEVCSLPQAFGRFVGKSITGYSCFC